MIDNLKSRINSNIFKIGKSLFKEMGVLGKTQRKATELLSTIKTNHPNGNLSKKQIATYRDILNGLLLTYNKVHKITVTSQSRLTAIDKIVANLNTTVNTLSVIVTTLQVLPAPAQFSTLGIIMVLSSRLNNASTVINEIRKYLNILTIVLSTLLELFNKLLAALNALNIIIQAILALLVSMSDEFSIGFEVENDSNLEQFDSNIANNYIGEYKNYIFQLRIDDDPSFVIGDIKRSFAVATLDGKDVYFSDKSYTLNPEILIDQLKLQIDK